MTDLTPEQRRELAERAKAATPGPWESHYYYSGEYVIAEERGPFVAQTRSEVRHNAEKNAAFIAAANPQAVLSLLAERDRLAAALEKIAAHPCGFGSSTPSAPAGAMWPRKNPSTAHAASTTRPAFPIRVLRGVTDRRVPTRARRGDAPVTASVEPC